MAILEYNDVRPGVIIVLDGEPYECLSAHVFRKQQRKPVNATKLRNLKTGSVKEHSFGSSDKVAEAELESRPAKYLYVNKDEYWFCEANDPSKRFEIEETLLGEKMRFIKPNSLIDLISFNEKVIGVKVPIKVELKVTEAPPDFRGNTAQGGSKQVTLETGTVISVPMFVKEGDNIRINTIEGVYVERA